MDDTIALILFTKQNLRQELLARPVLQLLFGSDATYAPEYVSVGNRWKRVGVEDIEQLSQWWPRQINVSLERRIPYKSAMAVSMGQAASGFNSISCWITTDYFGEPANLDSFLELSTDLYELLSPTFGYIHPTKDELLMSTVNDPKYGKTIVPINLQKGLPAVYWGNFFGPAYVSLIGRGTLLELTVHRKIELADGGLLILTTHTPLELDHDIQERAKNEIGQDFFYEWGKNTPGRVPE